MKRCRSQSPEAPRKRQHVADPPRSEMMASWLSPTDSPSNPFGRSRSWQMMQDLPPPTPFSKHLTLRFQYVRRGSRTEQDNVMPTEGVYRIVQVPKNYTLVHLRSLVWWLFGGIFGISPPEPHDSALHIDPYAVEDDEESPYKFELKKAITMSRRPGQIKKGTTWAIASGLLDPYLYAPDQTEDEEAEAEGELADDRRWMAEEDVTLAHIWPNGLDVTRGFVYTHNPFLQVHITINTLSVPARQGKGRDPFVFIALGNAYLDPPFASPETGPPPLNYHFKFNSADIWNVSDAFRDFYIKNTVLPLSTYQVEDAVQRDVPEMTFLSSSPARSSSPMVSTPLSSRQTPDHHDPFSSSPSSLNATSTPAPRPAQRKRIMRMQRQIGALSQVVVYDDSDWEEAIEASKMGGETAGRVGCPDQMFSGIWSPQL
ncbi:Carbohydrate esterase family 9 protein [Mycena indigotica]|uniref:Carbohydrate esterase family 9 protein n=1 Tax=Mycena indigotica TaxID=2126181 RepID=A0A8H6S5V3_9AGAR|nr:Carbohydrate esterase family 9 protein [Mycena indigotica]KAF7291850.1 Carbohydrate esterase family 9 protein [Mycena indigotica]